MRTSLLNLISTPMPVLNSLGLRLKVGLSSEDPTLRCPTETYVAYLSVYSPEGLLLERVCLGEIPPSRRRMFDVSDVTTTLVPNQDHLAVVHRIPSRLLAQSSHLEEVTELQGTPDYSLFRSLVEYSYPQGGNGSLIYETPPGLNATLDGRGSSNTLTFTCQIVVSELIKSYLILLHHSVNPAYSRIANFRFGLFSLSGELVASEHVRIGPFSINVVDMDQILPRPVVERDRDIQDGQSAYTLVGSSSDAAILSMVVNASPKLGAVAIEHTHPPQAYLLPFEAGLKRSMKAAAQSSWESVYSEREGAKP